MSSDIWNLSTLCRCCHADSDFRNLTEPYTFRKNVEVYSEMLKETFLIELVTPSVTSSDMICEDCVYLVRSAWRFKRQVQECETKFKEYCLNELNSNIKIEDSSDNNSIGSDDHRDLKPLEYENEEIAVTKVEETNNVAEKRANTCTHKYTKHKKGVTKNKETVKKKSSTICVGCRIHFSSVSKCSEHMDSCKLVYKCKYCGNGYPSYGSFTRHLARHVAHTEYTCDYCGKTFKYKKTLMKHVKAHMGLVHRLQCDLCSTQCNDSTQLRIHKRTVHENLRPFACDICDETFKANKRLKIHYRTHTGEKPYHCDICKESFICREYLLTHRSKKHNIPSARVRRKPVNNGMGNKDHICHICGKTLGTKYVLERHIQNRHLNMKRFPCGLCGKRFVGKGSMNRHISSIHNPERKKTIKVPCTMCKMKVVDIDKHMEMHFRRPHACSVCLKRFSQKNALNRHIKDVHALIKPHVCVYCGAAYVIKHRLKLHIEKHHNTLKMEFEEPNQ